MGKPIIAIVASYHSGLPCNNRFNEFAELIAIELEILGTKAMISYTPVISDGIT